MADRPVHELLGNELRDALAQSIQCGPDPCAEHHCQPYIGSRFGYLERLLFVGLDHGKADTTEADCLDALKRQHGIIKHYRIQQRSWNPHYKGCIRTADELFRLGCGTRCMAHCKQRPESECVLLHFAQANAVKSVPHSKKGMKFGQVKKISSGAEELVAEIQQIRPSVIILQGRDLHPTLMNEFIRLGHSADRISAPLPLWRVSWNFRLPLESYLVAFFHPAHGWLEKQWKPVIQPAMKELLNEFDRNQ